jgi:hypothetical protein
MNYKTRGTGAKGQPYGIIRTKLAAMLKAWFTNVRIYAAQGRDRTDKRGEKLRWEGTAKRDGYKVSLRSDYTMTRCVRYGIVVRAMNITDHIISTFYVEPK